jgi:hypothetical protein
MANARPPTPTTMKASRQSPSHEMSPPTNSPPNALPSDAEEFISAAPRARSRFASQSALSLAPEGSWAASAAPRNTRITTS